MKRNGWIILSLIAGLVFVFSGCAGRQQMADTTEPVQEETGTETSGMETGDVVTEEIQPIQPKEMQDIYFAYDRFDLSPEARSTLADNAAWLENHPGAKVRIQGHCDERGTNEYNVALGDRRAKSTYKYLINLGISSSRLSTISYGEERPQCRIPSENCWSKNRRSHFSMQ